MDVDSLIVAGLAGILISLLQWSHVLMDVDSITVRKETISNICFNGATS